MKSEKELYLRNLQQLIHQGYQLFSKYHLAHDSTLDVCLCGSCMTDKEIVELRQTPLLKVKLELFKCYVNSAYSEGETSLNEFKYFLPLFLDFMAQNKSAWISEDYFFKRVSSYPLSDWTGDELQFLQAFAENYINLYLFGSDNVELKTIEQYLESFQIPLFDTEKLAVICLNHPSPYCLIDYATQIVNQGYDVYEQVNEFESYSARIGLILLNWKYNPKIRQHFIKRYQLFKAQGYVFECGNENWVEEWMLGIDQGKY